VQIAPAKAGGFRVLETSTLVIEFFTTPTGVLFIGTSTPGTPSLSGLFGVAYRSYATHCVLNPMQEPEQPIKAPKFEAALEAYVRASPPLLA
jgi:Sybindin-like family